LSLTFSGCALFKLPGQALETVGKIFTATGKVVETTGKVVETAGGVAKSAIDKAPDSVVAEELVE